MRKLRFPLVLVAALFLVLAPAALAEEAPVINESVAPAIDSSSAEELPIVAPEIEKAKQESPLPFDMGPMADLLSTPMADLQPVGFFGPHCSGPPSPWTCPYTEPGLGCPLGGECTYSCLCDNCTFRNGTVRTVAINCQLVDDGGCLACALPL